MPRHTDEDDDGENWDDFDSEESADDDDAIPCPYCRRPIYEDAVRCPHCEKYLSREDSPPGRKPVWIIVGTMAVLAVVYIWIRYR